MSNVVLRHATITFIASAAGMFTVMVLFGAQVVVSSLINGLVADPGNTQLIDRTLATLWSLECLVGLLIFCITIATRSILRKLIQSARGIVH